MRTADFKNRLTAWLPWLIAASSLAILAATALLASRTGAPLAEYIWAFSFLALSAVGALVASRRPENLTGWLLCVAILAFACGLLFSELSGLAVVAQGSVSTAVVVGYILGNFGFSAGLLLILSALIVFPSGRLPSPRFRWLRWFFLIAGVLIPITDSLQPDLAAINDNLTVANPLHSSSLAPYLAASDLIGTLFYAPILATIPASMIVRYRRGGRANANN